MYCHCEEERDWENCNVFVGGEKLGLRVRGEVLRRASPSWKKERAYGWLRVDGKAECTTSKTRGGEGVLLP